MTTASIVISKANQLGDYTITIGDRRFSATFDGKFHRAGMMRAKTAEVLASLIAKTVK